MGELRYVENNLDVFNVNGYLKIYSELILNASDQTKKCANRIFCHRFKGSSALLSFWPIGCSAEMAHD